MAEQHGYLKEKRGILARMDESYRALREALERAGPELLERPGSWGEWTLKDLVAHLTYWHGNTTDRLQRFADGRAAENVPLGDAAIDEINANVHRANKDRSLSEMLAAFAVSYHALRTAVKSIPAVVYTEDQQPTSVPQYVAADSYEHYEEHIADIEHAVAAQGGRP